jgi:hypothetical protein
MNRFILAQLNNQIQVLINQIRMFLSNPFEYRQQLAIIAIILVFAVVIFVLSFISFANFLENRRIKRAIRKRAKRKLTPFEKIVRLTLTLLVLVVFISGYVYTHYDTHFCKNCHLLNQAIREHSQSKPHRKVQCFSCHADPGVTGKLASLPREARNLLVNFGILRERKVVFVSYKACLNCHFKIKTETVGTLSKVRHSDFIASKENFIRCDRCHQSSGHKDENLPSKHLCSRCHNGKQTFALKECNHCHQGDVTITETEVKDETLLQKIGTGPLKCYNACHPKEVDARCTPCHGTVMPHPQLFIRQHAKNSYSNRTLCVRCHAENGATTARACGCHPAEGGEMHGTYENWFIEHQKAARSNPYLNCLCHTGSLAGHNCAFCHIEGSPLIKSMIENERMMQQGINPGFTSPGP